MSKLAFKAGGSRARKTGLKCSQHTRCSTVSEARLKRDFGAVCTVGCDGSSSSEEEAEPHNIWNALLAAMVHFRVGEVLQPLLTTEDVGKVALSCHLACDALCAEHYGWDEAERG